MSSVFPYVDATPPRAFGAFGQVAALEQPPLIDVPPLWEPPLFDVLEPVTASGHRVAP